MPAALPAPQFPARPHLDYDALVRPWLCEQTLAGEAHSAAEDFFFRTVHLGTDCWASVALARMRSSAALAGAGSWHAAAARATQAARILSYLGDHVRGLGEGDACRGAAHVLWGAPEQQQG